MVFHHSCSWKSEVRLEAGPGKEQYDSDSGLTHRWGLRTKNYGTILIGPIWGFDPKSVKAENLRDAIAEYREAIRLDASNADHHRN